jgi:TonB family protein
MTNTATPVESIGAPSGAASFYCWEVSGKPVSIYLSLDLLDRLEREAIETFKAVTKRGSEIGGVLVGRVVPGARPAVVIEQFEPVECTYSRGSLYLLSDEDKTGLEQTLSRVKSAANGLSAVGFFRSNARSQLVLDDDDLALAKERFSDPNQVFLLVRPFAMKPSLGGFFFWENGQIQGEECYQQFPFKRAELLKSFEKFILPAPGKAAVEAPAAREPLVMPKREERPVVPPISMKREEPAPVAAPPLKREEPPPPPPPVMRREEPVAPPPVSLKREEPKPPVMAPPPPPPVMRREEPRPSVNVPPRRESPPLNFRREERRPMAPPIKREERPPIAPQQPRREERPSGPALVGRREEPPAPPVAPRREERPPAPPVAVRREEPPRVTLRREEQKPAVPPVVAKREEPAPVKPEEKPVVVVAPPAAKREEPAPPKPEEKPIVVAAPPAVKREEPAPPKQEEKPVVVVKPREPVVVTPVKKEEPVRVQPAAAKIAEPAEPKLFEVDAEPGPGLFSRLKWAMILLPVLLIVGGAGYYFLSMRTATNTAAVKPVDTRLGLKLETNAGSLQLSWDRNAPLIASATRAILTITDGDRKEDTELDLGQLRNGSIVYSPITNDVSFRLEVTDVKHSLVGQESVRRLAGKPTSLGPSVQNVPAKPTPAPEKPGTTPPLRASATPPPTPVAPSVTIEPAVTKEPPKPESLSARIHAAEAIPEQPRMDNPSGSLSGQTPVQQAALPAPPPTRTGTAATPKPVPPPTQPAASARPPGGQAQPASVVKRFPPVYPQIAITGRVEGTVRIQVVIGKDGKVKKATAVSGPTLLRRSAADAVQRWLYKPAILNGEPVEADQQVDVNFKL